MIKTEYVAKFVGCYFRKIIKTLIKNTTLPAIVENNISLEDSKKGLAVYCACLARVCGRESADGQGSSTINRVVHLVAMIFVSAT